MGGVKRHLENRAEVMTLEVLDNITWFNYREEVAAICEEIIWSESADTYYTDSLIWNKCDYKEYLTDCALAILEYIDEVKECYKYTGETWPDGRRRATNVPISAEVKWAIRKDCRDYIVNNTRLIEDEEE